MGGWEGGREGVCPFVSAKHNVFVGRNLVPVSTQGAVLPSKPDVTSALFPPSPPTTTTTFPRAYAHHRMKMQNLPMVTSISVVLLAS